MQYDLQTKTADSDVCNYIHAVMLGLQVSVISEKKWKKAKRIMIWASDDELNIRDTGLELRVRAAVRVRG